ncbi:MAG: DMT family transporter [Rhodospirillales bacterium]|nr:DMT family transporter [Rhodospirillales bacterium]MDP6646639.1 DMT family transporter [Rhodospirillales bacterium]MDP6840950.1 DMT family transporter [Rhodospirillales bacterium]
MAGAGFLAVFYAALFSALLAIMWVIVRQVAERIHAIEITFFGVLFGFIVFLPSALRYGPQVFHSRRVGIHFVRGVCNGIAILAWFWALTLMPLADATALNLLAPLMVTVGAIFFLGESVGPRRWFALGLGALGAMVIIRPGFQEISLGVWLALATVVFSAFQRLIAKSLAGTEANVTSVLYLMAFMVPVSLAPAALVWVWPRPADYLWLFVIGGLLSGAHFALMKSLQLADVSALEPVSFTRLLWGALFGYLFFAEVPDTSVWVGGIMIISATTYVARREAALRSGRSVLPESANL